jgi:hypothetical protein
MKEVRFDTGNKKTADAFFDENLHEYRPLQNFVNDAKPSPLNGGDSFAAEQTPFASYLKQALLFFPGTFILFYISLATAGVITDLLKNSDRHFIFEPQLIFAYLLGFLSVFFTWFGLGDLKNTKHFVIPGSIILSGAIIGVTVSLTDDIFWLSRQIIVDFGYAIWLFPIGLIVPILAKGWIDRKD